MVNIERMISAEYTYTLNVSSKIINENNWPNNNVNILRKTTVEVFTSWKAFVRQYKPKVAIMPDKSVMKIIWKSQMKGSEKNTLKKVKIITVRIVL